MTGKGGAFGSLRIWMYLGSNTVRHSDGRLAQALSRRNAEGDPAFGDD